MSFPTDEDREREAIIQEELDRMDAQAKAERELSNSKMLTLNSLIPPETLRNIDYLTPADTCSPQTPIGYKITMGPYEIEVVPRADFDEAIRLLNATYEAESAFGDGVTNKLVDEISAFLAKHGDKK